MSERMTAEKLAEIEKRHAEEHEYYATESIARRDRGKLLADRRSQTPPRQGVHEVCDNCGLDLRTATTECPSWHGIDCPPCIAEKPAPTVTPLTEEERNDIALVRRQGLLIWSEVRLLSIIERLSASPTAPKGEA